MTWVDGCIIAVLALSALMSFGRGLVREVLGLAAWIGAGVFAKFGFPFVAGPFHRWIGRSDISDPVAFGVLGVGALIVLSVAAGIIGNMVRFSAFNSLDRTLGIVFGLLRGAALVVFAYVGLGLVMPPERWPPAFKLARLMPYVHDGAAVAVEFLPHDYRPSVPPPPAEDLQTQAQDLMRANPLGRALRLPGMAPGDSQ